MEESAAWGGLSGVGMEVGHLGGCSLPSIPCPPSSSDLQEAVPLEGREVVVNNPSLFSVVLFIQG